MKGNIGNSGRIYHVPGTAAYEKTKIDEAKGERWFCSEDEARAAGWRAPRG
ncbi:sunset domain-containing protein [Neisseria sp. P0017.S004]|uniref:sunset domain-containing protein n=1 Tax=Neisseria sp. P0017.S004 TaxID=3436780 RepID=UPI003F7F429E